MTASVLLLLQLSYLSSAACDSSAVVWSRRRKTRSRSEGLSTLCCIRSDDGRERSNSLFSSLRCSFLFESFVRRDFNKSKTNSSSHNGDSCGVCPCWLRPQPRAGNGARPRAGFRRRASVQQSVLHRRGRLRHGVVSEPGGSASLSRCVEHLNMECFARHNVSDRTHVFKQNQNGTF